MAVKNNSKKEIMQYFTETAKELIENKGNDDKLGRLYDVAANGIPVCSDYKIGFDKVFVAKCPVSDILRLADIQIPRIENIQLKDFIEIYNEFDMSSAEAITVIVNEVDKIGEIGDGGCRCVVKRMLSKDSGKREFIPAWFYIPHDKSSKEIVDKILCKVFAGQRDNTRDMEPAHLHDSKVLSGDVVSKNIELACKNNGIPPYATWESKEKGIAVIRDYSGCVSISRTHGYSGINWVLSMIKGAEWNTMPDTKATSLTRYSIRVLGTLYNAYGNDIFASNALKEYLKTKTPKGLNKEAILKYPDRKEQASTILYIIDVMEEKGFKGNAEFVSKYREKFVA